MFFVAQKPQSLQRASRVLILPAPLFLFCCFLSGTWRGRTGTDKPFRRTGIKFLARGLVSFLPSFPIEAGQAFRVPGVREGRIFLWYRDGRLLRAASFRSLAFLWCTYLFVFPLPLLRSSFPLVQGRSWMEEGVRGRELAFNGVYPVRGSVFFLFPLSSPHDFRRNPEKRTASP